jgi:hypothetical protein
MAWRIYWYPEGASTWSSITLPNVTRCEITQERDISDAVGRVATRLDRGGWRRVRITSTIHRINDEEAWQNLQTLEGYLRLGGRVAIGPSNKMFLGFSTNSLAPGNSTIYLGGNVLSYDSASIGSTDYLLVSSADGRLSEVRKCSSVAAGGTSAILTVGLKQALGLGAAVRSRYCFPVLYLPEDRAATSPIWSDDRYPGLVFDLDLELEELPGEVFALAQTGKFLPSSTQSTRQGRLGLNEAIMQATGQVTRKGPSRGLGGRWQ